MAFACPVLPPLDPITVDLGSLCALICFSGLPSSVRGGVQCRGAVPRSSSEMVDVELREEIAEELVEEPSLMRLVRCEGRTTGLSKHGTMGTPKKSG